jgi:hypothetical protein
MSSRRINANSSVERSALEAMARRSPADYTVATLTETWRQHRDRSRGTVQVAWSWPVLGAFLVLVALSAVLITT